MMKKLLMALLVCLLLGGCAEKQKTKKEYPRKPSGGSERKSGPAMLLYEQAEKDLDINENVIVTPPAEKKKRAVTPGSD